MKEVRQGDYLTSLPRFLKRFFCSEDEAVEALRQYLEENPTADKATIFNDLSIHKGVGKSHHRGFDTQTRGHHHLSPRKLRNKW